MVVFLISATVNAASGYHDINNHRSGEGGWDYLTVDMGLMSPSASFPPLTKATLFATVTMC